MQDHRLCAALQESDDILQPIRILLSIAPATCQFPRKQLLRKHVKIHCELIVVYPKLKSRHIGHYHLPGPVYGIPCREYKIRVFILHLTRLVMGLVLRLGLDTKEMEAFVDEVLADLDGEVYTEICSDPTVSVRRMCLMDFLDLFHYHRTVYITG